MRHASCGKSCPFISILIAIVAPEHRVVHLRLSLLVIIKLQATFIEGKGAVYHLGVGSHKRFSEVAMEHRVIYESLASTLAYCHRRHCIGRTVDTEVAAIHCQLI